MFFFSPVYGIGQLMDSVIYTSLLLIIEIFVQRNCYYCEKYILIFYFVKELYGCSSLLLSKKMGGVGQVQKTFVMNV